MPSSQNDNNKRSTVGYWLRWLKNARKAAERHIEDADCAWAEYENGKESREGQHARCYPIYYSSSKYLEAAFYARDPNEVTRRKFDIDDEDALTQELIVQRLADWLFETANIGEAMRASRDNFIHADKAANQWIVNSKPKKERYPLRKEEDAYYEADSESPYEGEVLSDGEDFFYEEETDGDVTFTARAVQYDECLHTPEAKSESEIIEKAYHFALSKEEAYRAFPKLKGKKDISWRKSKSLTEDKESTKEESDGNGEYLCGWEIYCKATQHVYWVSEDYPNDFIESLPVEEVSKFRNFFPSTSFIINSKPRKSMFPTPVFKQLEPTTNQLHKQYEELMQLVEAARPRFIVNSDDDDLIIALETLGSRMFIASKNFGDILAKAGIENLVQQVPVDGVVAAMSQLVSLDETFRTNFAEWFGTPDIIKGVSEGEKTKAEVEIEHGAAYDRFQYSKKQVEGLTRDTLDMGIDLALDKLSDEKIAHICGRQYMERGKVDPETGEQISLGHYERFPMALAQLRNDEERLVRIDIQTDATSFTNEMREMQKRNSVSQILLQGLASIGGMENQQFMPVVLRSLLSVLEAAGGSVVSEDGLRQAVKELEELRNQPPPPAPPDFTEMKVQVAQQSNEIKAQKNMLDAQATGRELDQKDFKLQLEERKQMLEEQISITQTQLDQALVDIEQQKVALDEHRVLIEQFQAKMGADEARLEEMRLAIEQERAKDEVDLETVKTRKESQAQPPTIVVVDNGKDGNSKRVAQVTERDDKGRIARLEFRDEPNG